MKVEATVLILDDEVGIRKGLCRLFEREGFSTFATDSGDVALGFVEKRCIDIAILDVRLKNGERGEDILRGLKKRDAELPVVMITGYGSVESAVAAMRDGASDYILKPIDNAHLLETVRRYLELARLKRDNIYLKKELLTNVYAHNIITKDPAFSSLVDLADRVKDSAAPVLLTGESGTGKEVFARHIHFTGSRRDGPFVGINCAALSESLLLSELFGHEKGSFTGAIEKQIGKFELAHRGTLFLDEIGDMSAAIQAKLLRVLEEACFERLGGTRKISVDIRIIAATNQDLGRLMSAGTFRRDLLYRINTIHLHLPPLREHREDIPLLADYFVKKYAVEYRKPVEKISGELIERWRNHPWPGNIRELKNVVNQAVLLSTGVELASERENAVPQPVGGNPRLKAEPEGPPRNTPDIEAYSTLRTYSEAVLGVCEREYILRVLLREEWNQSRAARAMGITRKTLAKKMTDYGIRRPPKQNLDHP